MKTTRGCVNTLHTGSYKVEKTPFHTHLADESMHAEYDIFYVFRFDSILVTAAWHLGVLRWIPASQPKMSRICEFCFACICLLCGTLFEPFVFSLSFMRLKWGVFDNLSSACLYLRHRSSAALLCVGTFRHTVPLKHPTSCPYFSISPTAVRKRKWHDCKGNKKLNIIGWFSLLWKNAAPSFKLPQKLLFCGLSVSARTAQVQKRPNTWWSLSLLFNSVCLFFGIYIKQAYKNKRS